MFDRVPDMAAKRAELSPNGLAFRDEGTATDWTFGDVNRAANAVASAFDDAGLAEGDRVAILCLNRAEFFITLFACQKTGIMLCPLNWRQPGVELATVLGTIAPKALLHDAAHTTLAGEVAQRSPLPLFGLETDIAGWISEDAAPRKGDVAAGRPWYLLVTSGTTGTPKAVIQTPRMSWANAVNIAQATRMTSADRSVNFLPLFHTAGINLYTLPLYLLGGQSVILPKFDEVAVSSILATGDVTQFFGVPAIYQALSLRPEIERIGWENIRCGCGGAPLPEPLIRFFADRGARVLNGFGMTETGPTVFLMDPDMAEVKIGSVGRAQMLTEVRLAGVGGEDPGEGEVQLRGPNVTPGYFDNAEATSEAFTDDGWLRTGDVGRRDADGYVYIVDRIKDMFISGGENVYPAEVERVLNAHPAILEAAVVGVPDKKWGEVGAAFLLLRPGRTIEESALKEWCRERLAAYKVPVHMRIVDDLPRTAAGKVRKPDLRKMHECA